MDILYASIIYPRLKYNERSVKVSMAVRSKEDILNSIKEKFGDDTSDSTLSFIEDVNDTINDLETKASDTINWQQKYEENDKEWREKYKERFFSAPIEAQKLEEPEEPEIPKPKSFDDLFKVEKE